MTRVKLFLSVLFMALFLVMPACQSPGTLVNQSTEINNQNWSYVDKIKTDVKVEDHTIAYNIYFNLRHTADYKYSNIFILLHINGPTHQTKTIRYEFKLANPDGEWLGNGSGNLYSYQLALFTNYHFLENGTYTFTIEQNMRDNPLQHIADVGLRVEKSK